MADHPPQGRSEEREAPPASGLRVGHAAALGLVVAIGALALALMAWLGLAPTDADLQQHVEALQRRVEAAPDERTRTWIQTEIAAEVERQLAQIVAQAPVPSPKPEAPLAIRSFELESRSDNVTVQPQDDAEP